MKAISQEVVEAACVHLRSLPPKEAIVALVVTDVVIFERITGWMGGWVVGWSGNVNWRAVRAEGHCFVVDNLLLDDVDSEAVAPSH